jgi:DNA-directed RNA polymerase specialized sigma24 family protein
MAPRRSVRTFTQVLDRIYSAARAVTDADEAAGEVTCRVLVADPLAPPDAMAARAARLAVVVAPHPSYRGMEPDDRQAVALARALGLTTDQIALQLQTTPAEVMRRLSRGLRTLRPPRDFGGEASPARGERGS